MTYVEIWSENVNEYYINIVKEGKKDMFVDEIAKTKDRSLASYIAKHIATKHKLNIQFRINNS